jgi:hypothetical protein
MHLRTLTLLAGVVAAFPGVANAQFRTINTGHVPAQSSVVVRPVIAPRPAFNVNPYAFGFNPYGGADPFGGYLQGAAALTQAQGQYFIQTQQAYLLAEDVKRSKLETRRAVFDQYLYEKANTPTLEQQREIERQAQVARSQNNPPLTEIWSGKALNDLLVNIQMIESQTGARGPAIPIDYEILNNLNFTTGRVENSSVTMIADGRVDWLPALQRATFDGPRQQIDKLAPTVVMEVASGKTNINNLDALNKAVRGLRQSLRDVVAEMSSTDYITSLRFVNQLQDAVSVMYQPNAANFFSGKWNPTGVQNVGELVEQMTRQGLRFSAASSGDENYYTALHRAMVTFQYGLQKLASR